MISSSERGAILLILGTLASLLLLILLNPCMRILFWKLCRWSGIISPEHDPALSRNRVDGIQYDYLSYEKKKQVKLLRNMLIIRCLSRFTIKLTQEEHGDIWIQKGEEGENVDETNACFDLEEGVTDKQSAGVHGEGKNTMGDEIFQEMFGDIDMAKSSDDADGDNSYTHISIPYPGQDHNGVLVIKPNPKSYHPSRTFFNRLFRNTKRPPHGQERPENDKSEKKKEEDQGKKKKNLIMNDKRTVPIFCPICFNKYLPSDKITWSSNISCTHVFHTECIYQWLALLGEKSSRTQLFSEFPTHFQLLNYSLECPCCRQDFIDKELCLGCDESGESNRSRSSQEGV